MSCNRCGKKFDEWDKMFDFKVHRLIGYGSVHDGDMLYINLCPDCFDAVISAISGRWKINPIVEQS